MEIKLVMHDLHLCWFHSLLNYISSLSACGGTLSVLVSLIVFSSMTLTPTLIACSSMTLTLTRSSRSACGGTLSGTGQIRTPFHPDAYPHNKECEWVINQPPGYAVTLSFLSFDVEGGSCRYDFVEVRSLSCPIPTLPLPLIIGHEL